MDSQQHHDCEVALAHRLKALKELMDHQDGELERLMYLSQQQQQKAKNIRDHRLEEAETKQFYMNVTQERLRPDLIEVIKDEIVAQKIFRES